MRAEIRSPFEHRIRREPASAWLPIVLLAVSVAWVAWSVYALVGGAGSLSVDFGAAAGWFAMLALAYLSLHGMRNMEWTGVPFLITIEALLTFALIPAWQFADGDDTLSWDYIRAMNLALIGFAAFWIGSLVFIKKTRFRFVPRWINTPGRVGLMSAAALTLGVLGNLVLWKTGLSGYTGDAGAHAASLGFLQWLLFLGGLLNVALVVSAIEIFAKQSPGVLIRFVFWAALAFSTGFGVISGMKTNVISPLLIVMLVSGVTRGRFPRWAIFLPPLFVILVYPFIGAFRSNLNAGYRDQFNTIGGLEATVVKSFDDAFLSFGSTSKGAEGENSGQAAARLSYLSCLRNVSSLPSPAMLNGDEKVWMAPLYPLIPRFLWKGKPILDKGTRLAYLNGDRSGSTSAAITPVGDLYAMYGTYGIIIGMFVWGACLQLFMNWIKGRNISEKSLFVYVTMMPLLLSLEADVVGLIATTVQNSILTVVMALVIYGRSTAPVIVAQSPGQLSAQ